MGGEVLHKSWQEAHEGGALSKLLITLTARGCKNLKPLQHTGKWGKWHKEGGDGAGASSPSSALLVSVRECALP